MLDVLATELRLGKAGGLSFWLSVARIFLWTGGTEKALICIRLGRYFAERRRRRIAKWLSATLYHQFACMVSDKATIGAGLALPCPVGIVIGEGVRIGGNCTIYQNVTLGGARSGDWKAGRYPVVGDDVVIFPGAKIAGAVTLGDRATIGANAVVIRDVPADHVAIGVPAVTRAATITEHNLVTRPPATFPVAPETERSPR